MALLARGGLQDHHHGVEVDELLHHCDVYDPAGLGIDLDRLLAEKEARHVEVMDRHVAEDTARMSDIVARRQARVAAGDDDLTHLANLARVDGPAQLDVAGIETAVEGHHDARVQLLELAHGGIGLGQVVVDRLLAKHRLSGMCGLEHQVRMGVGRRTDDHRIDVGAGDQRFGVRRGFAAQPVGQRTRRSFDRVCHRH